MKLLLIRFFPHGRSKSDGTIPSALTWSLKTTGWNHDRWLEILLTSSLYKWQFELILDFFFLFLWTWLSDTLHLQQIMFVFFRSASARPPSSFLIFLRWNCTPCWDMPSLWLAAFFFFYCNCFTNIDWTHKHLETLPNWDHAVNVEIKPSLTCHFPSSKSVMS